MSNELTGGCLCGRLRYRARSAGTNATLCHCESCRRAAGAPVVAWVTCQAADFAWTAGEPGTYDSSPGVTRGFCGHCGTPLTYAREQDGDWVDLTLASLDAPAAIAPTDQIWVEDRLPWMAEAGSLPAHARSRDGS
jgi:hypothetical protein